MVTDNFQYKVVIASKIFWADDSDWIKWDITVWNNCEDTYTNVAAIPCNLKTKIKLTQPKANNRIE